jgi:hypothetical protein
LNKQGRDGGLRALFRARFPTWQWSAIESDFTATGIPDSEYCTLDGVSGWIEFKQIDADAVRLRPLQINWIERRAGRQGRVTIAIRRRPSSIAAKGRDELWLVPGIYVRELADEGLKAVPALLIGAGGPTSWNWAAVEAILVGEPLFEPHRSPRTAVSASG